MKVRVHELAKKYEIGNKEFLSLLSDLDIEVSSHLSGLTEDQVDKIKSHFSKDEKAADDEKPNKKKKKSKIKEKNKESVLETKKDKSKKKKKGRRTDFFVKKADTEAGTVVEEDGIKIIKMRGEMTLGEFAVGR